MSSAGSDRDLDGPANARPAAIAVSDPAGSGSSNSSPHAGADTAAPPKLVSNSPSRVAAKFVQAVAWGEHLVVWDLFSTDARSTVLRVAVNRGMDERLAGKLRDSTATDPERDAFLVDLVNGLRSDLRECDLDRLEFDTDPVEGDADPNRAFVTITAPLMHAVLGSALPVASMELVREIGHWRVQRLSPRTHR